MWGKGVLVFLALFTVLLGSAQTVSAWSNSSFDRCKDITISNAGSPTLTNFPAYINLTYDSDMLPNFRDIRFYSGACAGVGTQLDYEIENYTASSRSHAWIRIPSLPAAGTTVSVYYKNNTVVSSGENATGVWDSNYRAVWHLKESGNGSIGEYVDSTSYARHGRGGEGNSSRVPNRTTGKIGYGQDFDGVDEYIAPNYYWVPINQNMSLNGLTLEAWYSGTDTTVRGTVITQGYGTHEWNSYGLFLSNNKAVMSAYSSGVAYRQATSSTSVNDNNWHYVVGLVDTTNNKVSIYVDGAFETNGTWLDTDDFEPVSSQYNNFSIGASDHNLANPQYPLEGIVDEARISRGARSDDWINQSYQMVASQANFVSFGSEQKINHIDSCSVLNAAGETYLLTQDVWNATNSTCMDVQANSVILDCQGNRIDGVDGGDTYGVFIINYDNVTVRNCEISDWTYGIYMSSSTDDKIYNNLITSTTARGINAFSSSNYNNFTNNTVYLNAGYGVVFLSSLGNNFSHGNVSNSTNHGFWFSASNNTRIEYTKIDSNTQDGVNLASTTGNVIYESNLTSNQARGIYLSSSSGNRIEGGGVKSNKNTGIRLSQSTNNNISSVNSSLNTNYGIYFESSSNGNRIDNAIVSKNTLNGMHFDTSGNNLITGFESYSNNVNGIAVSSGSNNNFTGCRIQSNGGDGISLSNTYNNFVIDTVISASGGYQIYATDSGSSNNYFINSTFDKNDVSVNSNTRIWVKWYLLIQVRDTAETPLGGANVSIKDKYNKSWFSGQTNSSGYIPRRTLNEYNQTSSGKSFYTNYTVDVNKSGYPSDQKFENLTASRFLIVYLQVVGPPSVQVKTYTRALVETSIFKPNRMVRVRASVTSSEGRDYLANATIVIKDHLGVTKVNRENMTNVSEITNGYVYEYNYTLPGDATGLWLINVTATDNENRKNHDFKKIAVVSLNFQVKILLNDTWDPARIYIPGAGEKTFTQLSQISPYTDVNPPHYYLASYLNNVLLSLVISPDSPLSVYASAGAGKYEVRMDQRFSNSMVFLVFSRGNWRQVNNRIGMIEKGEFLSQISPTFSYGLGDKYPLKIVLSYDKIDINNTLSIGRGYSRVSIENKGSIGNKVNLGLERA